ncbi:hypothetical protein [Butyrivibrio sp. LC3010]|uniref:hypothetical protein n=1 Tax=Butyrivibrio sp. LC3010 TaxID=1280680 RepID=UPI00041D4994|nr:hypothetical protein [Butyrivibrio sp. LC3010]
MNRNCKKFLALMCGAMLIISGCGGKNEELVGSDAELESATETIEADISATAGSVEQEEAPAKEEVQPETEAEEASDTEAESSDKEQSEAKSENEAEAGEALTSLPQYEYPDKDSVFYAVSKHLVEVVAAEYEKSDVSIPVVREVAIDESNPEDVIVYGDFDIYNYDLDGDTLMTASGGNYPGAMHLKKTDDGYEVTSFDVCEDGSAWNASAKKIFGEYFDKFMEIQPDDENRQKVRIETIAQYVEANNLPIKQYQDFGWDPVMITETD